MATDDERYDQFMVLHAGEMREKALAAVGSPCPACLDEVPLALDSVMPWLICANKHRIRPWTEVEIEAVDNAQSEFDSSTELQQLLKDAADSATVHRSRKRKEKNMGEQC